MENSNPGQFEKVEPWVNVVTLEHGVLDIWREDRPFDALRERNAEGEPWSFLDGPITANNPMGVHHAWGRSLKDAFQRYHAMNGRSLRYQNGFDCQGLWVEVEVEKAFGFESKREIRDYGIDHFVQRCKERVLTFAARQTEQSIRLGYWMDWDDPEKLRALSAALHEGREEVTVLDASGQQVTGSPETIVGQLGSPEMGGSYFTFSTENNYTIWSFIKKCHDEGHIYRGTDVMPWCFRCGTGLSQMEITEGRKITTHTSVFVRFPLRDREGEALLVWTTTPWTLTSNVAAAVNPEMDYLKVRHGDWVYYLGKGNFDCARVQNLEAGGKRETHTLQTLKSMLKGSGELEVLGELKGSELVGLTYDGPFDHLAVQSRPGGLTPFGEIPEPTEPKAIDCHRVIAWDEVSDAEGTGIVHIAPGCGAEDARLGKELGLVSIAPLNESGHYLAGFGELTGKHVLEVTDTIVMDLKTRGRLVAKENYPHVYPHCWRCKQELVFRLVDEWFISMAWRERIQKTVPQIRWIPADGEAREMDWLRNMGDWMISKKRFWGLALPIWACEAKGCGWFDVIGGPDELKARAVEGYEVFEGHTPHRPWIDAVKVRCEKCGEHAPRVEDVGNPWLDAGIVPFSTVHFGSDPSYWKRWFPADLVLECFPGQFRNWFYALLAMSAMMDGRPPFKALLGHALVRDEHGKEMHKSTGNAIWFDDAAEEVGADVMRWLYARQDSTSNLNFGPGPLREVRGGFINTLWNTYAFFANYARLAAWQPPTTRTPFAERDAFDRWILSELQRTTAACREGIEALETRRAALAVEAFVDDLSNWYVRHNRRRFWKSDEDANSDVAFETLYECLRGVMQLSAPFIPFLTEAMHQNIVRGVVDGAPSSVHLERYPSPDAAWADDALTEQMRAIKRMTSLALAARDAQKIKVRQPLASLTIGPASDVEATAAERFREMLAEDLNVKAVEIKPAGTPSPLEYDVKPNFKRLGPRFKAQMKAVGAAIRGAVPALLEALKRGDEAIPLTLANGDAVTLEPGDLSMQAKGGGEDLAIAEDHGTWVAIDTLLTDELKREGLMRDALRGLQTQRKDSGLEPEDRIELRWTSTSTEVCEAIEAWSASMAAELLAETFTRDDALGDDAHALKLGSGRAMRVVIAKVG